MVSPFAGSHVSGLFIVMLLRVRKRLAGKVAGGLLNAIQNVHRNRYALIKNAFI